MAKWSEEAFVHEDDPEEDLHDDIMIREVDPRVRMKEIRAEVAMYLKEGSNPGGLNHMGELPDNLEDARRVIVAIQDLYETEKTKHSKATDHICNLVHTIDNMVEDQHQMMGHMEMQSRLIQKQRTENSLAMNQISRTAAELTLAQKERDALLTTMRLMNKQPTDYGVNINPFNSPFGYSNKEQG